VGVKSGVGVKVGVKVGLRVSVGVMLESPGRRVLVPVGVAERTEGVGEEESGVGGSGVSVASVEAGSGVAVASVKAGFGVRDEVAVGCCAVGIDGCVAGTGGDTDRVGDGLDVAPTSVHDPAETAVGACAVPHPAKMAESSSTVQTRRSEDRLSGSGLVQIVVRSYESRSLLIFPHRNC
jgi:hypothetical protein